MKDSVIKKDQEVDELIEGLLTNEETENSHDEEIGNSHDEEIENSHDEDGKPDKENLSVRREIALLINTFKCNIEKKPKVRSVAVTAEEMANERLEWGYELVFDIIKRQKRFMITFSFIFITLLFAQYGYLVYKIETVNVSEISSVIIVQLVMLAIETLGILGIITKFIFSNQTKEIIDGIYKHAHYHKEDSKNESKTTEN